MNFAKKLRRLRAMEGMTQSDLAEKLGVSLKTISRYEVDGMRPRSRDIYNQLANLFRVDASYLLVDDDDYKVPVEDRNYDMLVNGVMGLFAGGTLSDEDKKAVVEAITDAYYKSKYQGTDKKRAKLVSEKYLDDALALIEEHGTNDPYEILENLGVVVIPIHIGAAFLGMFRILDGVSYVIYNTHADEIVIREVLAHELGHFLYHKEYASEAELADFGLTQESSIIEAQANTFAAHLLIDEEELLDTMEEGMSYMELAQRLMVDENLLLYKLKSMKKRGLKINLSEAPRSQFFQNLAEQAKKYDIN